MDEPLERDGPIVTFFRFVPECRLPMRADRSAAGTMPTRSQYDFSYAHPYTANQQITIPTTRAGAYYILIYGDKVPAPPGNYSIEAVIIPFSVQTVTLGQAGTGPATLQISGAQFNFGTTFQLRTAGGTVLKATRTLVRDSATAIVADDTE